MASARAIPVLPQNCKHCLRPFGPHSADSLDCTCPITDMDCNHHHSHFCNAASITETDKNDSFRFVKEVDQFIKNTQQTIKTKDAAASRTFKISAEQLVDQHGEEVECYICMCIVKNPIYSKCCTKLACRDCFTEAFKLNNNCPHCRSTTNTYYNCDALFIHRLDNRRVKCDTPNCSHECTYFDLITHQDIDCLKNRFYKCNLCDTTYDEDNNQHGELHTVMYTKAPGSNEHVPSSCDNQVTCPYCKFAKARRFSPRELMIHLSSCKYAKVYCTTCHQNEQLSANSPGAIEFQSHELHNRDFATAHLLEYRRMVRDLDKKTNQVKIELLEVEKANVQMKIELTATRVSKFEFESSNLSLQSSNRILEQQLHLQTVMISQIAVAYPDIADDSRFKDFFTRKRTANQAFNDA